MLPGRLVVNALEILGMLPVTELSFKPPLCVMLSLPVHPATQKPCDLMSDLSPKPRFCIFSHLFVCCFRYMVDQPDSKGGDLICEQRFDFLAGTGPRLCDSASCLDPTVSLKLSSNLEGLPSLPLSLCSCPSVLRVLGGKGPHGTVHAFPGAG